MPPMTMTTKARMRMFSPIPTCTAKRGPSSAPATAHRPAPTPNSSVKSRGMRSEEHTSELQSRLHLVCRLLLEKKKRERKLHDDQVVSQERDNSISVVFSRRHGT